MTLAVWHDDQQETAAVTLAGLINSLKIVGKSKASLLTGLIGAGAASIAVARILPAIPAIPMA